MLSSCIRHCLIVMVLLAHCLQGLLTSLLPLSTKIRLRIRVFCTHLLSKAILKLMQVTCYYEMSHVQFLPMQNKGRLVVSNHQSVIDILLISAFKPCVFITSQEVNETPIVGFLARAGGCIFVERRNKEHLSKDISQLIDVLSQGFDVVLFAEGTTSDGSGLLPFKTGLFKSVIKTKHATQPMTIQFLSLGGSSVTSAMRDRLFYFGDHKITDHLKNIFNNPPLKVRVLIHGLVFSHLYTDAKLLANAVRSRVEEFYLPTKAVASDRDNSTIKSNCQFRLA